MNASYWISKVILFAGVAALLYSQTASAQLFKKLKEVVKQTATQTAEDRATSATGNATNKIIDSSANAFTGLFKKHRKNKNSTTSEDATAKDLTAAKGPTIRSYQNYDFVPGDTILFTDDFAGDQDGEFPSHWNLEKGQGVVNTVAGKPAFCLTQGNYFQVSPRMKTTSYLSGAFTIEFDTYCDENNSEQGSPYLYLTYTDKDGNSKDGRIEFEKGDLDGRGDISLDNFPHSLDGNFPEALRNTYPDSWHHCAIIYKNNQLKCYVDQYRILTVPHFDATPTAFGFEGVGNDQHPTVITNIRLASGGNMNMIGNKFTEAKIVTHGITFDVDKSDLKPQSMGTLNMIVNILNNNPDIKFEIDGHTDNTGQTAHNLTLSEQRADAVKTQLVKMGIPTARLTTKGLGDTQPISENDTPEGRANNRRVEFIRQ